MTAQRPRETPKHLADKIRQSKAAVEGERKQVTVLFADARHRWLNTTFFIGEGRVLPGNGVEYRVWRPA